jgi:hypothetical protein
MLLLGPSNPRIQPPPIPAAGLECQSRSLTLRRQRILLAVLLRRQRILLAVPWFSVRIIDLIGDDSIKRAFDELIKCNKDFLGLQKFI